MSQFVVANSLYEQLPKLADDGIIKYDARSRTVRYRGRGVIEEQLNAIANAERE